MTPHDIRRVLRNLRKQSTSSSITNSNSQLENRVVQSPDGKMYFRLNMNYQACNTPFKHGDSLIDRGANGGFAGNDVRLLEVYNPQSTVDVYGIEGHAVKNLTLGTVAGLVHTHKGPVVCIMHQYIIHGKGSSIHSSPQLEHFGNQVDDRSRKVGGKQQIITSNGYVIPLQFRQGLAYINMSPPSDKDLDILPHVVLTSKVKWDPSSLDNKFDLSNLEEKSNSIQKIKVPSKVPNNIKLKTTGNYGSVSNPPCEPPKVIVHGENGELCHQEFTEEFNSQKETKGFNWNERLWNRYVKFRVGEYCKLKSQHKSQLNYRCVSVKSIVENEVSNGDNNYKPTKDNNVTQNKFTNDEVSQIKKDFKYDYHDVSQVKYGEPTHRSAIKEYHHITGYIQVWMNFNFNLSK